ncbi:MAG: site-2 protease family protein [Alphaproteobacteria bacterium]|nr:site-2 protease family protein [Alphaproteobacteria bacterium]
MLKRVTLFRFFGFDIKADGSWLFLSVLICWTLATTIFPPMHPGKSMDVYYLMSLATLVGIFVSIIAHEVAHAIIAEYYHMPISSITLFIFGGVAEMKGDPSHPRGEFLMAMAGPAMSALMGLLFYAASDMYIYYVQAAPGQAPALSLLLHYLGDLNLLIAAFNMIPAFPLDGGRALRAIIWHYKNNLVLATRVVSLTGFALAYGLIGYACYMLAIYNDMLTGIWSGLLGLFVHGTAAYSVRHIENRSILSAQTVRDFMDTDTQDVSPDINLATLIDNYAYKYYQKRFPVTEGKTIVGVISLKNVMALDRNKWQWLHVSSVMEPIGEHAVIDPDASAAEALDAMQRHGVDALFVAQNRQLQGVISLKDIAHYLSISMKVDQNMSVSSGKKAY